MAKMKAFIICAFGKISLLLVWGYLCSMHLGSSELNQRIQLIFSKRTLRCFNGVRVNALRVSPTLQEPWYIDDICLSWTRFFRHHAAFSFLYSAIYIFVKRILKMCGIKLMRLSSRPSFYDWERDLSVPTSL